MSAVHKGPGRSAAKERFWRKHVADQARSGLTARAYCEAHGLSEHSFYGWRRELGQRDFEAKRSAPPLAEAPFSKALFSKTQFAEVVLTGAAPLASSVLQIHLPSHFLGARIEVFAGCDRTSLEMALAALRGEAC